MPDDPAPDLPGRSPALGRFVAGAFAALVLMVVLGVFWIWRNARNEQDWRDRINATETFITPTNR